MTEMIFNYAVVILSTASAYWIICDGRRRLFKRPSNR